MGECIAVKTHTKTQKEMDSIIEEMRQCGCRISKKREIILDTILKNECSSPKEIYLQANRRDKSIGIATIYRTINLLEDMGVIDPRNKYKATTNTLQEDEEDLKSEEAFRIINDEDVLYDIREKLRECGYTVDDLSSIDLKIKL